MGITEETNNNKRIINIKSVGLSLLTCTALHLHLLKIPMKQMIETSGIENMQMWFRLLWDIRLSLSFSATEGLALFIGLTLLFGFSGRIMSNKRLRTIAIVLSLVYAFFCVFGESFMYYSSWSGVFGSLRNLAKAVIKYSGSACLSYSIIKIIYYYASQPEELQLDGRHFLSKKERSGKSLFVAFFVLILICWLPYAYAYYPGLTNYDFFDMLNTYYGIDTNSLRVVVPISDDVTLNNNNPVLQVLMAVATMKLGDVLGSPYYGIALFCYSQMVIFAAILSLSLVYLNKREVDLRITVLVFLFYAFLPWNPNFALATLKDTNYSYFSLLYIMLLADMIIDREAFFNSVGKMISTGAISLLMMLLRNNGVYVLLPTAVVLLIVFRKHFRKVLLFSLIPILIYLILIVRILYPALGISPGSRAEMYSLPIQQIARLISEEGDQIEEQDQKVIAKVLNDYDELADRYDPELADPVKSRFNKYATGEDISNFVHVWAKYLKKYPGIYIQAAVCDCYGYFYPEAEHWLVYTQIEPPGEAYGLKSPENRSTIRKEMNQMAYIVHDLPGLGLLMRVGFYSWVMFATLGYLIYSRKKIKIAAWIPHIILLLTVLAGPANTMPRYIYPIIISTPFLVSFSVYKEPVKELKNV